MRFIDVSACVCTSAENKMAILLPKEIIHFNGNPNFMRNAVIALGLREIKASIGITIAKTYAISKARVAGKPRIEINSGHTG